MAVRHQAEKIGLAVTTAAGPLTILADVLGLLDEVAPNGIQMVTLLILTSVTVFLLLEVRRFEVLDNVDRRLERLDVEATAERLKDLHYGGVVQVHPAFPAAHVKGLVREARQEVAVLQTFIPNLRSLLDECQEALTRNEARVRILLLLPTSSVVSLRQEVLREAGGTEAENRDVRADIERNLGDLGRLHARLPVQAQRRLEVRVYNSLPSMAVYRADNRYLVSSFVHSGLAIDSPQTEIHGTETVRGAEVQREFDTLWRMGRAVDLEDWEHSINLMDFTNAGA